MLSIIIEVCRKFSGGIIVIKQVGIQRTFYQGCSTWAGSEWMNTCEFSFIFGKKELHTTLAY